jgi:hypothetical protein
VSLRDERFLEKRKKVFEFSKYEHFPDGSWLDLKIWQGQVRTIVPPYAN